MIRILICDDQAVVRDGLEAMLQATPNLTVVATARHGREAVELAAVLKPDVVLMDLKMPKMDGVKATRLIREQQPAVAVLVLTTYATDEWVMEAIQAGASGYLLKDTRREALVKAIEGTVAGKTFLDPEIAGTILNQATLDHNQTSIISPEKYDLSARECTILTLIAAGKSNPEIGEALHLSAGTIRNYISRIFEKLGVSDRTQAAVWAVRLGLV
jgi:DNA-binding NarL/FixJ family response regulator